MKTLEQLREALAKKHAEAKALIEQPEMSAEDEATCNAILDDCDKIKAQIKVQERMESAAPYLDGSHSRGRASHPEQPGNAMEVPDGAEITGGHDRRRDDPWAGFDGCEDYVSAVRLGSRRGGPVDDRLAQVPELMGAPTNFHRETASDDGYMAPPALRDGVLEAVEDFNEDIFSDVDDEPTDASSVEYLRDESTPWGSSGVQAYWAGEGSQFTPSRLSTEMAQLKLHKCYAFVLATDELLSDAARLFDRLTRKSGQAIAWKGSEGIWEGTGAGQPLGINNAGSLVTVAKETSQTADTIVAANVAKMFARVINPTQAFWYVNQDVLPELITMTLGDKPIYIPPAQSIQDAPGGFLLGRPVKFTEHAATLGDAGDINLFNPRGYYSPRKPGVKFAQSMHLYFDYDIEAFRWTFRMGGTPYLESAITPNKGSNTRSHFVTLAERA